MLELSDWHEGMFELYLSQLQGAKAQYIMWAQERVLSMHLASLGEEQNSWVVTGTGVPLLRGLIKCRVSTILRLQLMS